MTTQPTTLATALDLLADLRHEADQLERDNATLLEENRELERRVEKFDEMTAQLHALKKAIGEVLDQ